MVLREVLCPIENKAMELVHSWQSVQRGNYLKIKRRDSGLQRSYNAIAMEKAHGTTLGPLAQQ